jgi:uncharacterized damage-inducible protein DinB
MPSLEPLYAKLVRAQDGLLRAADGIFPEQWETRPGDGAWSAGEIVAHLIMVERAIIGTADRLAQKKPKPVPLLKRFHLPLALVESRLIRRKSPIPLDPQLVREKEAMLAELREVRERTLAFLEETRKRDLNVYHWPHAFLGVLNAYEWFELVAAHEARHTKQMKELSGNLLKAVARLQK